MGLINLVIKDYSSKTYDVMLDLRENTHNLITENVCKMQRQDFDINIHLIERILKIDELENKGWKKHQGLYDKLIMEYNQKTDDYLKFWE